MTGRPEGAEQALTKPARRTALVAWVAVGLLALGAGVYVRHLLAPATDALPDAAVMGVTLPDLDGKPVSLAQFRGTPLVVNFWASWCGPCREEMPAFVQMQKDMGFNSVQFVGIGIDNADKLRQFAQDVGLNYPALVGGYGALELSRGLGNQAMALPFTLVVDRHGAIVERHLGPMAPEQLRAILARLA